MLTARSSKISRQAISRAFVREMEGPSRRAVLGGLLAALFGAPSAHAQDADQWVNVRGDHGTPIPNVRIPSELDPFGLPGILWFGAATPDVNLFEFFDYNCPVCRASVPEIDALVRETSGLRLGLIHNAILSPGSVGAARTVLAVLRLAGPQKAYELHRRLFSLRGHVDERRALAAASDLGVSADAIAAPDIARMAGDALAAHMRLAKGVGFEITPSYVLQGIGLFGHPGPRSLRAMIAAAKECDELVCP